MPIKPLSTKNLPTPLPLRKLIGPSFILLGMGLGSGEVVLWPHLTSNFGMGIIWGAILGISLQFVMNMEIERYALVHGESIFVGFARKLRWLPVWFMLSTFLPWIWPGIAASSAKIFIHLFGLDGTVRIEHLSIGFLLLIGLILSLGPILYKTVEKVQMILIILGVPFILGLAIILAKAADWQALAGGIIGKGDGYWFLPVGIPIASFLAALAYAGAGGNLNLAQSQYVREKGYGMGKYAGRIKSLLTGKKAPNEPELSLTGNKFEPTPQNLAVFKTWWKHINIEHGIVFWLTGAVTMVMLGLLAYSTVYGQAGAGGIDFLFLEAEEIGRRLLPTVGTFFLIVAGLMLFGTQLGVFDASSRMISENAILASNGKLQEKNLPKIYYIILWAQILAGIIIFLLGFTEPLRLIIIAAVLNAFAMFVHVGLTLWTNLTLLDKPLRPGFWRIGGMALAFTLYGGFSIYILIDKLF